ncbi:MAG TPA: hypothetical protein VMN39_02805 [Longimicrobiaceae bacterium]|nr:hypothetical protein [Longimicrobiaceae bacterium]
MAKDPFPIDDPDDEIPPANPARRRVATITACLFVLVVLGFIIWFTVENSDPPAERRSLFGWAADVPALERT